eukprot:545238-Prorocentrum_minimum.AAC.1
MGISDDGVKTVSKRSLSGVPSEGRVALIRSKSGVHGDIPVPIRWYFASFLECPTNQPNRGFYGAES